MIFWLNCRRFIISNLPCLRFKCHSSTVFLGINSQHVADRYGNVSGYPAKARLKRNSLIADFQVPGGGVTDIQHNLPITHEFERNLGLSIGKHRNIRCKAVIAAPLMQGADQIWLGRG